MKAGAVDFLTKPVSEEDLLTAIERAEEKDTQARQIQSERASIRARLTKLTPCETEVLTHVVAGRLNKQIARDLGAVERTIKVHRARAMQKMGVRTVPDLVRLAEKAGIPRQTSFNDATMPAPTDRREFEASRGSPYIQRPNLASLLRASPSPSR
jgi:FixJ family two-component response regulator